MGWFQRVALGFAAALTMGVLSAWAAHADVTINEIRTDQPGTDNDEYFELAGAPGESLDGLTYLVIGDGSAAAGSGVIEAVVNLTGQVIGPDGVFCVAEATLTFGTADLVRDLNFENTDNFTHLLVRGFTGTNGQDLDTNDDGVLDATPWTEVVDDLALVQVAASERVYSTTVVGPDGSFVPGHVFRLPDGTGGWRIGTFAGGEDSPGEPNSLSVATPATIPDIQSAGHVSPFAGQRVVTTGIVTAVLGNGFHLQDPAGDGDDATSDGIFVFTSGAPSVAVGDAATVEGLVSEFIPGGASTGNLSTTEIVAPTITVGSSGNPVPAPVVIGPLGRTPPTQTIDDDALATFDPASDGIDFYECLEGMRVTVQGAVAVSPTNRFGEIWVLAAGGAGTTGRNARGGITIAEADFNPERVQIQLDGTLLPGFSPQIKVNDVLGDVTGVVGYNFGNFEVVATATFVVVPGGLVREVTTLDGGPEHLTVGSCNLLNLDPNDLDGDDDVANGQFDRLAQVIAVNLRGPDIVALQEVQDDSGSTDDGVVTAGVTLTMLRDAVAAAGGPVYAFIDAPPVDGEDGGQPGGNIRVAYFYDPARVTLVAGSVQRILDPNLSDGDAFENSRKPLRAQFAFGDATFTLINNHFSSKGGSTPLFGVVQPPVNGSLDQRIAQAHVVRDVVDSLLAADANARVIVLGDLNEFDWVEPLEILQGGGATALTNMTTTLAPVERYSYVFEGNSQELDHVLVSPALAPVATHDVVHTNAEFPDGASDHDPLLERIHVPIVRPALPTARDVLAFFEQAARAGRLRGVKHDKLQLVLYGLGLALATLSEERGHGKASEALLQIALLHADGNSRPKDTLEGPALGELADLLRRSLSRF
jgi:predicted extracellular nuclease